MRVVVPAAGACGSPVRQNVLRGVAERRVPVGGRHHVAPEERMVLVELHVNPADRLSFFGIGLARIRNLPARVGGGGQPPRDVHRSRAEQRRIDPVVDEPQRRGHRQVSLRAALRRSDDREVARQHRRCGDEGDDVGRRLRRARPLVGGEEEDLVLDNRPADHPAELVPDQPVRITLAGRWIDGRKRARRVELVMAEEFECVAVEGVGARLGGQAKRCRRPCSRSARSASWFPRGTPASRRGTATAGSRRRRRCCACAPSSRYATPNCWPPATEIPRLPVRLRLDGLPVSTAPPARMMSAAGLRPSSGIASTCSLVMTWPTAGLRVSTSGADASTETVSSRLPSSNFTGTTGLLLTCSTTPGLGERAEAGERRFDPIRPDWQVQQRIRTRSRRSRLPGGNRSRSESR